MRVIPAIDIINGKCVRLTKGDYASQKIYNENPLEVAKAFEDNGLSYLHLVDLDGAKSQRIINYPVLETICQNTSLKVDFGGGLKSEEDLRIAFESGAAQVTGGSIAVQNPALFESCLQKYGSEKIILGADCLNRLIATNGWIASTDLDIIKFIQEYQSKGITKVICTDISKDGMLQGPSIDLYREISLACNIQLIASGGISTVGDLEVLKDLGCEGAILGKAIYEGNIKLKDLARIC